VSEDSERLEEIRAREEKATPGPWDSWRIDPSNAWSKWSFGNTQVNPDDLYKPDAEFIAHAREDIPFLLDEIERLRRSAREPGGVAEREG
jgi:hypothetical protein